MRNRRKTTVLAVAAAALSLGLTACGGSGTGTKDERGSGASSHPSALGSSSASGSANTGATAQPASKDQKSAGSGSGGSAGTAPSAGRTPACTAGDVRITAAKADETPTAHIVLTAKNTSGHSCRLYQYPLIAFGDIHTAKDVPAVSKSNPGTPIVLKPGAPAYALVRIALGGAHEGSKVVTEFNVNLIAADGPAEGSVVVSAPAGGLAVDEAASKTGYWTYELRNGADEF